MTEQFSLAHLTVLDRTPPEMTYIAARAGYDFVSFRSIGLGTVNEPQYPLAQDKAMRRQTKAALVETGLKLLDIEMVRIYDGVDPKTYLPAVEAAAELGARHVLTTVETTDYHFAIDCFSEICNPARPFGLTIDLEFITWYSISTLKRALEIVCAANCDNGGILIDMLHFNRSQGTLRELDAIPHKYLHYVHVCDAPSKIPTTKKGLLHTARKERMYLGEGGIDVLSILNRLPDMPYSLEIPHAKRVQELGYEEFARGCLQSAKHYLRHSG